jgi:hypothetical protein
MKVAFTNTCTIREQVYECLDDLDGMKKTKQVDTFPEITLVSDNVHCDGLGADPWKRIMGVLRNNITMSDGGSLYAHFLPGATGRKRSLVQSRFPSPLEGSKPSSQELAQTIRTFQRI